MIMIIIIQFWRFLAAILWLGKVLWAVYQPVFPALHPFQVVRLVDFEPRDFDKPWLINKGIAQHGPDVGRRGRNLRLPQI